MLALAAAAPVTSRGGAASEVHTLAASEPVDYEAPRLEQMDATIQFAQAKAEEKKRAEVAAYLEAIHQAELERQAEAQRAAERAEAERREAEAAAATPPPAPQQSSYTGACGGMGDPNNMACWDRLAQCESGGNWAINTGNGYYGGIQFSLSSWRAVGGTGYPHEHSREEQIRRGQMLYNSGGWGHWPACTAGFGWR